MKLLLLSIWMLSLCVSETIDTGYESVNAVCKVTLKNGEELTGCILMIGGGYNDRTPEGFCWLDKNTGERRTTFYSLRRSKYEIGDGEKPQYLVSSQETELKVNTFERPDLLLVQYQKTRTYQRVDSMELYLDVHPSMYLRRTYYDNWSGAIRGGHYITIDMSRIRSIELLRDPPKEWSDKIQSARDAGYVTADYSPPLWYHELLKNYDELERIENEMN